MAAIPGTPRLTSVRTSAAARADSPAKGTALDFSSWGANLTQLGLLPGDEMPPDYDAEAIARVMGLGFVNAADVDRRVGRPSKIPRSIARVKLEGTRERTSGLPVDVDAYAREMQKRMSSRAVKVRRIGQGVIIVSADELPSSSRVPPSPALIGQAVEAGLHRDALRHVAETLAGGDKLQGRVTGSGRRAKDDARAPQGENTLA